MSYFAEVFNTPSSCVLQ